MKKAAPNGAALCLGAFASAAGRPGLVVAGRGRALAFGQGRTLRAIGQGRAGPVLLVRLLPFARLIAFLGRRDVDGVVQPAVPAGRDLGSLGLALVDHPAALDAERLVLHPACGAVIDIAELVLAHLFAEAPGVEARADGLAVPPGEDLQQPVLHRRQSMHLRRRADMRARLGVTYGGSALTCPARCRAAQRRANAGASAR